MCNGMLVLRISINLSRTRATDPNNSTATRFPGTMSSNFMAYIYIIKIKKELVRLGLHTEEDKHCSQNKLKTESSCFKPNTEKRRLQLVWTRYARTHKMHAAEIS